MCGIVGGIGLGESATAVLPLLKDMCNLVRHRGPDTEGFFVDDQIGLGMRRLKIIDLETGDQPIWNEDGSIVVVHNGEIYNYMELREVLISKGHKFYTHSDTEVIVHQYEEDGEQCVKSFRGMFAFALWDKRTRRLFLARDRFGVKPLFLANNSHSIAFASEMKAFKPVSWVDWSWSSPGLRAYLQLGYIPCPMTAYSGIRKFEQGSTETWRVTDDGRAFLYSKKKYWEPAQPAVKTNISFEDASEQLLFLLKESVRLRLLSDVPLGAFLSGGLDSSSVVALMRMINVRNIKTFSIGFEENEFNELPYAEKVARHFGTEHYTHIVTGTDAKEILPIISNYDEPFADSSSIPTYFVSKLAREHVTVSLSGDGGDELFAGYWHYYQLSRLLKFQRCPFLLRRLSSQIGKALFPIGTHKNAFFDRLVSPQSKLFLSLTSSMPASMLMNALSPRIRDFLRVEPTDQEMAWFQSFSAIASPADAQLADQRFFLADDILVKVDRSSMAVSLESREPLLDAQLAEFANGLPPSYHLQGQSGKKLFKYCMAPHIPKKILHRNKMGFCVPLQKWIMGPFANDIEGQLLTDSTGLFCQRGIEHFFRIMENRQPSACSAIWRLFCFAQWAAKSGS